MDTVEALLHLERVVGMHLQHLEPAMGKCGEGRFRLPVLTVSADEMGEVGPDSTGPPSRSAR